MYYAGFYSTYFGDYYASTWGFKAHQMRACTLNIFKMNQENTERDTLFVYVFTTWCIYCLCILYFLEIPLYTKKLTGVLTALDPFKIIFLHQKRFYLSVKYIFSKSLNLQVIIFLQHSTIQYTVDYPFSHYSQSTTAFLLLQYLINPGIFV